jgi:hypothetical protein
MAKIEEDARALIVLIGMAKSVDDCTRALSQVKSFVDRH